jgi:hypothetical protein
MSLRVVCDQTKEEASIKAPFCISLCDTRAVATGQARYYGGSRVGTRLDVVIDRQELFAKPLR